MLVLLLLLPGIAEQLTKTMLFHQQTDLEEQSEFPLWELETGEISNQGFYKCLKIKSDTLLMPSQMTQTKTRKFPRWEFDESYHSTVSQILHKLKEQCKVRKQNESQV